MTKIQKLSKEIIPRIAAGEVVHRPASVVKELIENSLDAKATFITIEIEDSGLKKIRVIDNGEGMSADDISVCFLPFTTSKLTHLEDLENITTLGFRGEALSSISSVARVTIKSKSKKSDAGSEIYIEGEPNGVALVGMSNGTIVEVADLFFNVPARKKFLKGKNYEYRNVLNVVTAYALANDKVRFKFSHNGKLIFSTQEFQEISNKIRTLLGEDFSSHLFPIEGLSEHIELSGFLSKPQAGSLSKDTQFLFVNGRSVSSNLVSNAVRKAYGSLLEHNKHSPFILYMKISHDLVDVNIHPRKEKINFWDANYVRDFLKDVVTRCLHKEDLTYIQTDVFQRDRTASSYTMLRLKDAVGYFDLKKPEPKGEYEEIIQIDNTYLATPIKEGFLVADQHSAHESILYEQFLEGFKEEFEKREKHYLPEPLIIDFSASDTTVLNENIETLGSFGFGIEEFGPNSYRVLAIPELLKEHDVPSLIFDYIENLKENKGSLNPVDEKSNKTVEFLACRSAVKAGEYLTYEERRNLLKKLDETKGYYTCPHGRPTKIIITLSELEKLFKRAK